MLVLVAGVTGNLGGFLVDSFTHRGHRIRGLARNPSKLSRERRDLLESFVHVKLGCDVEQVEKACSGVDAAICAYSGAPENVLEGQIILLRAAEKAGVKHSLANTWNCDWRDMKIGMQETYGPMIMFHRYPELTSSIKPVHIYCGVLAEVFFSVPGHGDFGPKCGGVWDAYQKRLQYYGTGDEPWYVTTEHDAAEFTAEIIQLEKSEQCGDWHVYSFVTSLLNIVRVYEEVRGTKVITECKGSVMDLRREALEARSRMSKPYESFEFCGMFYQLHTIDGTYRRSYKISNKLDVMPTSLESFLKQSHLI